MRDGLTLILPDGVSLRFHRADPLPGWRAAQMMRQYGQENCTRVERLFVLLEACWFGEVERARESYRQMLVDAASFSDHHGGLRPNEKATALYQNIARFGRRDPALHVVHGIAIVLHGAAQWPKEEE